jgi:hypothetical protein
MSKIRVVYGILAVGAKVQKGNSFAFQKRDKFFFVIKSCMITSYGNGFAQVKRRVL